MIKPFQIKLEDQSTVDVIRIDLQYIASGVLMGSDESIFRNCTEDAISESKETYGTYRPIQIIKPVFEDGFDYAVFLDLKRMDNDLMINDVGLLLFCSKENINLKYFDKVIRTYPDWTNSRTYSIYDD